MSSTGSGPAAPDAPPPPAATGAAAGASAAAEPPPRCVVLFDGVCDLCHTSVGWIAARDRAGRFEYLPGQGEEARRRYPDLDPAALERALHVVAPDGTVRAGAEALPVILRGLPGWGWRVAARVLELPPVMALARPIYAWVARRRHRISQGE